MKRSSGTADPWPDTYSAARFCSLPTVCSLLLSVQWLMPDGVSAQNRGSVLMSPGLRGEHNNRSFRHRGEESLTPPCLFHVCVYSRVADGGLFVCFWQFWTCLARSLAASLCTGDDTNVGWHGRLTGDATAQLSACVPSFLSLVSTLSPPFLPHPSLWVFPSFLCFSTSHSSVPPPVFSLHPSIYLSLSLMNISQRNAIYSRGIAPPLHPSSSDFSSARLFSRYQIEVEFHVNFNHHQFSE